MRYKIGLIVVCLAWVISGCRAQQPAAPERSATADHTDEKRAVVVQWEPIPVAKQMEGKTGVVRMVMTDRGFDPAELRAKVGGRVRIYLRNESGKEHNLVIPRFGIVTSNMRPGAENYIEFTASAKGEWPFVSDAPGQEEPGFKGSLKVE